MTVRNLDKIFRPRSVAVIGASDSPGKVGYTLLKNLIDQGFAGPIYPINPQRETIQGLAAYPSLDKLPQPVDLAVICTPAPTVPKLIRQCGEQGTRGVVIISAGFREVGAAGKELEEHVRLAAADYPGLRIIGPNCLGVMVPGSKLNASFAASSPLPGRLAFLSQSGALCTAVLDWSKSEGIGFSHFLSLGNMLDVGFDDLLDYLAADPQTDAVLLYVESITEAREFMSAARAFSRHKPIVAYKAGRFADSAKAASSHTGAMAGVDAVYEAAFQRAGMVRVFALDDMVDCAELLARQSVLKGSRLAIITNAGGPGVMACDALLECRGTLAQLSPNSIAKLNTCLPPFWSHGNPIDVLGDAPAERYADALREVLKDPGVDAALVILTPQAMTDSTATAKLVAQASQQFRKPVLAAWMGGESVREGIEHLTAAKVATYHTPEHAIRAFMNMVDYARHRDLLHETPRDVPLTFSLNRAGLRQKFTEIAARNHDILSENDSKELLEAYGVPVSRPLAAATAAEAVELAQELGYPVVMKILSPQITHKTDVQGVVLNLQSDHEVTAAFERMTQTAHMLRPDATIQGVTMQRMLTAVHGVELIVGVKRDPVFGPVIMVGLGGVTAELLQDRALELPPLNERLARRMLESLRSWPLLNGYRGRPMINLDRLLEVLMRFSYLVADLPEILEVDINPLLVTPQEVIALDARVIIDRSTNSVTTRPHAHLAICPYPEEFTHSVTLRDGTAVLIRPIKPEDEPAWHALLSRCSAASLWQRFRYIFKETTHDMATRFCFIDYDRELAFVAEVESQGEKRLIGVGRLVSDPDRETAEYAVLIEDAFQGQGLGGCLTDACLNVAKSWQLRLVYGETTHDNMAMQKIFRKRGFACGFDPTAGVVVARLVLARQTPAAALANS